MKPKNFPARKLRRQLVAQKKDLTQCEQELSRARQVRTKKDRRSLR